jgi:REP element-mobilizing transposase RayT
MPKIFYFCVFSFCFAFLILHNACNSTVIFLPKKYGIIFFVELSYFVELKRRMIMARTRRIKRDTEAYYHLMSRTNGKRFLFSKASIKSELITVLKRTAQFCGVELKAYTVMGNHFHVVVKVVKPDEPIKTDELLRRVSALKGEKAMQELACHWEELLSSGFIGAFEDEQNRLRARMHDISEFMKLFKEVFDRVYKRGIEYCGSIWSGRFTSTLIQDGSYFSRCKRYVVYNPVRAGIVTQAKDYQWSWSEDIDKIEVFAGPVPVDWCLKRVAQIGGGKVFGSAEFVMATAFALGSLFRAASVGPHLVGEIGYSTHGWRLALKG